REAVDLQRRHSRGGEEELARDLRLPPDHRRRGERLQDRLREPEVLDRGGVLTSGITVDFTAFTPEELGAAVNEAHSWGRGIAAHAIGAPGIENAVRAGVDSIEHGSQITAPIARLMKERGTFH